MPPGVLQGPAKSFHSIVISTRVCLGLLSNRALHFRMLSSFHLSFSANALYITKNVLIKLEERNLLK